MTLAQELPDRLLHAWIVDLALTGGLTRQQLVNRVSYGPMAWAAAVIDRNRLGDLAGLELADGVVGVRLAVKCRLVDETHVATIRSIIGVVRTLHGYDAKILPAS